MDKNSRGYSLKESDLREILGYKTKVIPYDKLRNYKSIHDLLGSHGNAIILYRHGPNTGHWVAVLYTYDSQGREVIEVFDPYGIGIDKQFYAQNMIDMQRYLSRLLLQAGLPVHYNHHNIQNMNNGINTCGRHAAFRIINADLSLDEYKALLDQYARQIGGSYDDVVVSVLKFY